MKKTYHLCLSGGDEVMFRCDEDYVRGINSLSLAAHKTDSSLLAYSFMSNHVHIGVRTESPEALIYAYRYGYCRYFNRKYGRSGRLGERDFFSLEIEGLYHLLTVIAYILRNPLHHGVSATPFGYKYSSISALFRKELGRFDEPISVPSAYHFLPEKCELPTGFKMNESGMIIPESVIDVADVEHQFSTARTFLYYMNRLSGDSWTKEQLQDDTELPPISLEEIEKGVVCQDMRTLFANEHGRANYNSISDLLLCKEIDKHFERRSIYQATHSELMSVAKELIRRFHLPSDQLKRCFGGLL